jgi:vanillate O-demethylase monooxygenase subunit
VSTVSNFPKSMQHRAPEGFLWRRLFEVDVPFFARLTVHFPENGRLSILNAASPVSARNTRLFVPIVRDFDKDLSLDDVYAFNRQVFEEDRAIVESRSTNITVINPAQPCARAAKGHPEGIREARSTCL